MTSSVKWFAIALGLRHVLAWGHCVQDGIFPRFSTFSSGFLTPVFVFLLSEVFLTVFSAFIVHDAAGMFCRYLLLVSMCYCCQVHWAPTPLMRISEHVGSAYESKATNNSIQLLIVSHTGVPTLKRLQRVSPATSRRCIEARSSRSSRTKRPRSGVASRYVGSSALAGAAGDQR